MNALQWSELIGNYIMALGVCLGGGWAFWKWGYSEWQESRKNRASIDGHVDAHGLQLADGNFFVTITSQWNNKGQYPIPINPKRSAVFVYLLPDILPPGPIEISSFGQPLFVQFPFKDLEKFELEPRTESSLRAHFVLEPSSRYLLRWELFKDTSSKDMYEFFWSKEMVWSPLPPNSALNAERQEKLCADSATLSGNV